MRCLITGGTGFIGSRVCEELLSRGNEVVLFDTDPGSVDSGASSEVTFVRGDIRRAENLTAVFRSHEIDCVIHLAALLGTICERDPILSIDINTKGTATVLELASAFDVPRIVNASSVAVYGYKSPNEIEEVDEDGNREPNTIYGSCKVLNEDLARHYAEAHDIAVTSLRFGSVFGPGRETGTTAFTSAIIESPVAGDPVVVPGIGSPNWLYVDDAVKAITEVATARDTPGYETYNFHTEIASMETAAEMVRELIPGGDIELTDSIPETLPGIWMEMNTDKIRDDLGIRPAHDLRSAFEDYHKKLARGG